MNKKLFLLPLMIGFLASCNPAGPGITDTDDDDDDDDTPVLVQSVTLNKKTLALKEGQSSTLTYTIKPSNADNKNVSWESSDAIVASVENGVVKAWNAGTADISVITEDGEKTDKCTVTVSANTPDVDTVDETYNVNEQGYTTDSIDIDGQILDITTNFKAVFNKADGTTTPKVMMYDKETKDEKYSIRAYAGNKFTISSSTIEMTKISMVFSSKKDNANVLTTNVGSVKDDVWTGKSKSVTYSVQSLKQDALDGCRAIQQIIISYEGQGADDPDIFINLGEKSISEVKQYIKDHPVKKNSYGNEVNENRLVTIKGYAMAKIDLIKSTSKYGLDVSEHGKVIMADATGSIGVATKVNNQGTSLWGKLGDHACESTSKYIVSGYLSEYLGHPEIVVTTFAWDTSLDIELDYSKLSSETISLEQFYTKAQNVNYNCAGHGYGDVVTIENLKCYYVEPDGQGKRYYNFTDGTRSIRVNAFNIGMATEGHVYDVTGIISLKNLSPIVVAFKITSKATSVDFDYENTASSITISGLKNIHGSQDDTLTRYPNVVAAYGNVYKTTGYMVAVMENGKLYVGISDTARSGVITGKTNAMANYNVVLIKNENFWNTTEDELYLFNPIYDEYLCEDKQIEIYYVVRQLEYSSGKPMWQILLIPDFVESLYPVEE